MKPLCLLLLPALFAAPLSPLGVLAAEAKEAATDPCELAYFKAALHFKTIDDGILIVPKKIILSVGKEEAERYFTIGQAVWKAEWQAADLERLRQIAAKSLAGEVLAPGDVMFLTDRRASLKDLRFLFQALSDDHEAPGKLGELAIALGKLRDRSIEYSRARLSADGPSAIEGASLEERRKAAQAAARRFQAAATGRKLSGIEKAIAEFDPAKRANFHRWLEQTVDDSMKIARTGHGSPQELHSLRKNMQAMLSVVRFKRSEDPNSVEWRNIFQAFVNVTEKLGNLVGEYEELELKGKLSFNHGEVEFPAGLMRQALDLLERVKRGEG